MSDDPNKKINFKIIILLVLVSITILVLCLYAIYKIEPSFKPDNIESLTNFQKQQPKTEDQTE